MRSSMRSGVHSASGTSTCRQRPNASGPPSRRRGGSIRSRGAASGCYICWPCRPSHLRSRKRRSQLDLRVREPPGGRQVMTDQATSFVGTIPDHYERGLGPVIFKDFAADIARRVAASRPVRVLEIAAGTGIVTRQLRDLLPSGADLTATDLNPPMLEVARTKFKPGEQVDLQPADATALPFADAAFDAVVCQFGVMFFPDKQKSYREVSRVLVPRGRYFFNVWDSHRQNPFGRIAHEIIGG